MRKTAEIALGTVLLYGGIFLMGCAAVLPKGGNIALRAASLWQKNGTIDIFTGLAEFRSETEAAAEVLYAEAAGRYEVYAPIIDEAISAYREDKDFTVDYAAYDRYFYFDSFSLPEGTIAILSRDNTCMGFRMNLRCREEFDGGSIASGSGAAPDREILCEYYEIGDIRYFSYADSYGSDTACSIPNFMCITEMEQIYAIDKEQESWTVYRNEFEPFGTQGFFWEAKGKAPLREYFEMNGSLYRIDREHKALFLVNAPEKTLPSGTPALADYVYLSWLSKQKALCQNLLYQIAFSAEDVEAVLPDGYVLRWPEYTVNDVDGDGTLDILAVICPAQKHGDNRSSYTEDSPYRKVPEYYYQELWLFMGQPDGSFLGERLLDADSMVWNDTYTLVDVTGFTGGFFMEYFVGRSPFETILLKYTYDDGEWKQVKKYRNDSYSTPHSFYAYSEDILAAEELYKVSVSAYVNEQYAAFLNKFGYEDYGALFQLPDEALVQRINAALLSETDKFFGAVEALDECHDASLYDDVLFLNSRIAVLEFCYSDETADNMSVCRFLPVSIDLQTGEVIDFRDYITAEELKELLVCTSPYCKTEENLVLFDLYDDYETLLKAGGDSMTLCLVHEGLLVMNAGEYWPDCCLIPRAKLLDSPLAVFWDDWQ